MSSLRVSSVLCSLLPVTCMLASAGAVGASPTVVLPAAGYVGSSTSTVSPLSSPVVSQNVTNSGPNAPTTDFQTEVSDPSGLSATANVGFLAAGFGFYRGVASNGTVVTPGSGAGAATFSSSASVDYTLEIVNTADNQAVGTPVKLNVFADGSVSAGVGGIGIIQFAVSGAGVSLLDGVTVSGTSTSIATSGHAFSNGFNGGIDETGSYTFYSGNPYAVHLSSFTSGVTGGLAAVVTASGIVDPMFVIDPSTPNAGNYAVILSAGIDNSVGPVPEPATSAMLLAGIAVLLGLARPMRARQAR